MNIHKSTKKEIMDFFEMDSDGTASEKMRPILHLHLMSGVSATERGYKSNSGYGRIIKKKTGRIDYLELSRLVHEKRW